MDLEETKNIIESQIEAEALTRNVRNQIKSYIDQKQNLREGFTETFKPLIESQEAVKASIDKEPNAMIEQLKDNHLALTEGLNKNRLAITQGFDKMDEVKRSDLKELPGFEAIEHPETKEPEEESEEESEEEREKGVVTFGVTDLDEGLINKEATEVLKELKLPLPSKLINAELDDIKSYQLSADAHLNNYADLLPPTRAILYIEKGVNKARKLNENPNKDTRERINIYNILGQYISNLNSLEKYAKKNRTRYHPL